MALKVSKPWIKNGQVIFDAKSNSIVAKGGGRGAIFNVYSSSIVGKKAWATFNVENSSNKTKVIELAQVLSWVFWLPPIVTTYPIWPLFDLLSSCTNNEWNYF